MTDELVALEQRESQLGCVSCGCTEPTSGWQGRVSDPREGWLCGPCTASRLSTVSTAVDPWICPHRTDL
jgi:hypothetical protein